MHFMVVVFPAPLGQRKPKTSPFSIVREISERRRDFPIFLDTFERVIAVCFMGAKTICWGKRDISTLTFYESVLVFRPLRNHQEYFLYGHFRSENHKKSPYFHRRDVHESKDCTRNKFFHEYPEIVVSYLLLPLLLYFYRPLLVLSSDFFFSLRQKYLLPKDVGTRRYYR